MPFFFFISGYLFRIKEHGFWPFFKQGINSLLIPYYLLNIISALIVLPLIIFMGSWDDFFNKLIDTLIGGPHSFAGASWFLFCLFEIRIIAFCAIKTNKLWGFISVSVIIAYILHDPLLFSVGTSFAAFPFFMIGYYIKLNKPFSILEDVDRKKLLICLLMILLPVILLLNGIMGNVAIYSLTFGNYEYLYYFEAFLGISTYIVFVLLLSNKKNVIVENLSNGCIILMCLHGPLGVYVFPAVSQLTGLSYNLFSFGLIVTVITVTSLYYPIILLRKKYPILSGGR